MVKGPFSFLLSLVASQDADVYAPATQSTKLGCRCVSECKTSYDISCHADLWCEVESQQCEFGAAHFAPQREIHFDYCTYPAFWPYETKSAAAKQELLMAKVRADPTPQEWPIITGMYDVSMFISLNAVADVFPQPRKKYMHAIGTVAPVRFVSTGDHPYTGLFKGAEHGLLRAGMTLPAHPRDGKYFDGVIPGVALKLFRDGLPSSNVVLIPDVMPQACGSNFFDGYFSSHIVVSEGASPFLGFASPKLNQGTACANQVGTSNLAADGGQVSESDVFPFKLEFFTAEHHCPIDCDDFSGSLANFSSIIPDGVTLYDVYATRNPGDSRQLIGRIELTGAFTTSDFGDKQLFFMHQAVEDDFRFKPEWIASPDVGCTFAPWMYQPPVNLGCTLCHDDGCGSNDTMLESDPVVV